jgi:hypothetical protein
MSRQQVESKTRCSICGALFHEPDMGALPGYDYNRQSVSDAHRAMFHSANPNLREYDREYLPAMRRLEEARQRRSAALLDAMEHNRPLDTDTPGPKIYSFRAYTDPDAKEVTPRAD